MDDAENKVVDRFPDPPSERSNIAGTRSERDGSARDSQSR